MAKVETHHPTLTLLSWDVFSLDLLSSAWKRTGPLTLTPVILASDLLPLPRHARLITLVQLMLRKMLEPWTHTMAHWES